MRSFLFTIFFSFKQASFKATPGALKAPGSYALWINEGSQQKGGHSLTPATYSQATEQVWEPPMKCLPPCWCVGLFACSFSLHPPDCDLPSNLRLKWKMLLPDLSRLRLTSSSLSLTTSLFCAYATLPPKKIFSSTFLHCLSFSQTHSPTLSISCPVILVTRCSTIIGFSLSLTQSALSL